MSKKKYIEDLMKSGEITNAQAQKLLDMLEVFVDTVLERVAISVAAVAPLLSRVVTCPSKTAIRLVASMI